MARIDGLALTHCLGRFKISGFSNSGGTVGLVWKPETEGELGTKVFTLANTSPFTSSKVLISDLVLVNPAGAPLPLELDNFSVRKAGNTDAHLIWSTVGEENSSHFQVERTFNFKTWQIVTTLPAVGYSSRLQEYTYLDKNVPAVPGFAPTVYYRLKMVDLDNTFEYSPIRSVSFASGKEIIVFPNPARQEVTIRIRSDREEAASARLFDAQGKQVLEQNLAIFPGVTETRVDCRHLPEGSYWIQVKGKAINFSDGLILMND